MTQTPTRLSDNNDDIMFEVQGSFEIKLGSTSFGAKASTKDRRKFGPSTAG